MLGYVLGLRRASHGIHHCLGCPQYLTGFAAPYSLSSRGNPYDRKTGDEKT